MKVLITGATGLVGKEIVKLCREQGIAVHYLTTSKKKIQSDIDYQGFYWNPEHGEIDHNAFTGVTAIIHLAGATIAQRWTTKNIQAIKDSRIKSARLLYEALSKKKSGVRHIISASAIGCYPSSATKYYDEKYPKYASTFLGEVVQEWEAEVIKFQQLDIATAIVRTGIILDDKEGALPKIMQPIKAYVGAPLGNGQQWQSWIHIEDMARCYMYILKNDLSGIYNGVAPNPVTNEKLTRVTAKILNKPLFLPKVPTKALQLFLGKMASIILESQKVSSEKIQTAGFTYKYATVEAALENLLK